MKPRNALITAAAAAATMVGASAAVALNVGILDTGGNDGVGSLAPTVMVADNAADTVNVPAPATITASDRPAVTTSSASGTDGSSDYDDDHDDHEFDAHDDDDHDDDDHDDHKYEGHDDDD